MQNRIAMWDRASLRLRALVVLAASLAVAALLPEPAIAAGGDATCVASGSECCQCFSHAGICRGGVPYGHRWCSIYMGQSSCGGSGTCYGGPPDE